MFYRTGGVYMYQQVAYCTKLSFYFINVMQLAYQVKALACDRI